MWGCENSSSHIQARRRRRRERHLRAVFDRPRGLGGVNVRIVHAPPVTARARFQPLVMKSHMLVPRVAHQAAGKERQMRELTFLRRFALLLALWLGAFLIGFLIAQFAGWLFDLSARVGILIMIGVGGFTAVFLTSVLEDKVGRKRGPRRA
jgi:hypothetical protein